MSKKETGQRTWLIPHETPFPEFSLPVHSSTLAGMLFEAARSYAEKGTKEKYSHDRVCMDDLANKAHAMATVIESAGANSYLEIIPERRKTYP